MKKYLLAAVAALALSIHPVMAEEAGWLAAKATQGKYRLYLNTQSHKREGAVVNASVRYVYPETQVFPFINKKYSVMERLFYFQCAERKMVLAQSDYFMGKDKVHSISAAGVSPFNPSGQAYAPQPVPPDTAEEEAFNLACKYTSGKL